MSDWLDALVSSAREQQELETQKKLDTQADERLRLAHGGAYFDDLKRALKTIVFEFNRKFGSEVLSFRDEAPSANTFTIWSHSTEKYRWSATVSYAPDAHIIQFMRSPGSSQNYRLEFSRQGETMVALYGNRTDVEHGLSAETLARSIFQMMAAGRQPV